MRSWKRAALAALAAAAALYGVVAADVVLRARSACLEGEKYMWWREHPEEKQAYFDAELSRSERRLQADFERGRMSKDELDERIELARFERDQSVSESSAKYAYVWFQTAADLFTPPESRWSERSRTRMKDAKKLWQDELRAKGIPFEDAMFE
jgi:hypothetical protein